MHRHVVATVTLFALSICAGDAFAANTEILLFNLTPGSSYQIRRNGAGTGTRDASRVGSLRYTGNASPGDVFEFLTGDDTQGPTPPSGVTASETSFGCVTVAWTRSSDPEVTGYRVYFGTRSRTQAAYTDSIAAGNATSASRCGLTAGNYYFGVRAIAASGDMSAFSKEVALNIRGVDKAAPQISQRTPAAGASGVPLNATIYFVAIDDKTGVNASAITVTVDGTPRSYTTSNVSGGVAVQCDPAGQFAADTDVDVALSVPDRATPPNVTSLTYHFHTGGAAAQDGTPPLITAITPLPDGQSTEARPTMEVRLRDSGLGVDLSSVEFEVNGEAVAYTVEGNPSDLRIRYRPATAFAIGAAVDVRVAACDRASPANCASDFLYRFTVTVSALASGAGAIVPDGYWANDPSRPLEVRDLPPHWRVRIFDTSGSAVRYHENLTDGTTWTWNFRNDNGQRVAPAIYMVRVTDASGTVQRSGRFLVQSGQ
jgi:hypothetical protein